MQALRTLVMILIATLFVVGGTARALPMPAGAPPCHEAPADHGKAAPVQAAMSCCVGCLPAPVDSGAPARILPAERPAYTAVETRLDGRDPAPEPGPPRVRV
ncbi:MAG: hypothetical protein ACOYM5_00400 [Caulobacter sp.]